MSASHVPAALRRLVRERAGECCEYCLIPEAMTWALHTIDHIIAEKHGGTTTPENLALACTLCNSRKGSDLTSIDEQTGTIEPLFHPRRDRWIDHFQLVGGRIEPRTAKGAAQPGCCGSTILSVSRSANFSLPSTRFGSPPANGGEGGAPVCQSQQMGGPSRSDTVAYRVGRPTLRGAIVDADSCLDRECFRK